MMRSILAALIYAALLATSAAENSAEPAAWAYAVNPPGLQPAPDDGTLQHVPNSVASFTKTQLRDLFKVPDWYPDDHPPMSDPVAHGRSPSTFACGFCHLPNGLGRPENSSLAGLSAEYIAQQVADFRSGSRKSSEPASLPVNLMIAVAKAVSEEDTKIAAAYFAGLKPAPWIRVVETETVPKTKVGGWMLIADGSGATEPIGQRIIEMPENLERTELRDSASGFIAYVPMGSVQKGEALAANGNGKTTPCAICHGADLKGLGPVPALAGRSPSYIIRQLYDIKHGTRDGSWTALMKSVVSKLSQE